jgi:hypothetical protein
VPSTASIPFGVSEDAEPALVEVERAGSPAVEATVVAETAGAADAIFVDEVTTSASAEVTQTVSDAGAAVPDAGATVGLVAAFAATVAASPAPVASKSIATQRSPVEICLIMVDVMGWPSAAAGSVRSPKDVPRTEASIGNGMISGTRDK